MYLARHVVCNEKMFSFSQICDPDFERRTSQNTSVPRLFPPVFHSFSDQSTDVHPPAVQHVFIPRDHIVSSDIQPTATAVPSSISDSSILHVPDCSATLRTEPHQPQSTVNHHPMITRAKAGTHKPKAWLVELEEREPNSVQEALSNPHWLTAMNAEFEALIKNKTWSLVPITENRKIIGCKWMFKVKRNPDGSLLKYKARLVTKGFHQVAI